MRKKKSLVLIRNPDDLQKILFIQASITRAVKNEMLALAIDLRDPEKYIQAGKRLLEKYATYPTLAEFAKSPKLANVYKWGSTFGVAALVGILVIEEVKTLQPRFTPALRQIFLLLLKELDNPQHKYLIDPLIQTLGVRVVIENVDTSMRGDFLRQAMSNLVESFVLVSMHFGVVTLMRGKVSLTPTGKRVLAHLADTARFIEEMGLAHTAFQKHKHK